MVASKMSGLSVLVVLQVFLSVGSAYDFGCPTLFDYYPHTTDCARFYRCVWGSAHEFRCPDGTHWSQRLLTCDHVYNSPCIQVSNVGAPYQSYDFYNYDNAAAASLNQEFVEDRTTIENTNEFVAANNVNGYPVVQHDAGDYVSNQGYGYAAGYEYPRAHWPALGYARDGVSSDGWAAQGGYESYSPWFQRLLGNNAHAKKK
ncbi:hypothetical protein SNE40_009288 [Patella caerulea]|uniref:Chitin-binding type-2 domain-containing protein n=1 Tax=Patella caerulea TaxID=87958 RepID=A0AAN8Q306_PATCE